MRSLALIDSLTGLFNRRHFEETVKREWRTGLIAQAPLALLLIDVDHLKRYNDGYGHPAGDNCLWAVAGALHSGARRAGDLLATIGGEEFAILMPTTRADEAPVTAEQVRRLSRNRPLLIATRRRAGLAFDRRRDDRRPGGRNPRFGAAARR